MFNRRVLCATCLVLAMLVASACGALAAQPSDDFYNVGRNALLMLENGDTDGAIALIGFQFDPNDSTYSEAGFRAIVKDKYAPSYDAHPALEPTAVCFYMDNYWYLALPVTEPVNDSVQTFVLISSDQSTFCGYAALRWGSVLEMSDMAQEAYWNVEYKASGSELIADQ